MQRNKKIKKNYNFMKKSAAAALAFVIAASMAGCGAGKTTENGTDGSKANKNASSGKEEAPKGRFVEAALPMPSDGDEEVLVLDIVKAQDGTLELYARETQGETTTDKVYRYDGTGWKEEAKFAAQSLLAEGNTLSHAAYGKDGTFYAIYRDVDYKNHLVRFAQDGSMEELAPESEELQGLVNGLYVKEDGSVIIPVGDHVLIVDASGTVTNKLSQKNPLSVDCDSHTLTANSFLTVNDQGFIRYDAESWNEEESIPFQNDETDIYGSLDSGGGDDFYLANPKGIHHMTAQGTMWETIVDGSLNTLGMPSITIRKLFVGSDNDYYLWYDEDEASKLVHYTFDPDMATVPSQTITVYGLDLSGNQSVKQAISLFQLENSDIRVEMIEGSGGSGGTSKTDTIRALNAELLNGNGADVLVLDGLPVDSYIEKGILDDLSDVITPMVESGELYSNIAQSFTAADGSIYQYPVRAVLPVIFGDSAAVGGTASLETLKGWQEENSDKAIFPKTIYENIVRELVDLYYPELKGAVGVLPDTEKIQTLLETAKEVGDASGCKVAFDESEEEGYNLSSMKGTPVLSPYTLALLKGDTVASIEQIRGMKYIIYPTAIAEKFGYTLQQFQDIYSPNGVLGVVKSSKEKDAARKFVEFALSLKVQEGDLNDGMPVNKKASEKWQERSSDYSLSLHSETVQIYAEYPDEEARSEVLGMLDHLRTPVTIDNILLEMMISETKGYFEGTQTAAEAAGQFENKAKLYYAE